MSAPAAMADDAIEIHPGTPNVYFEQKIAKGGDTKPIMDSAAYVVEDEFYLQRQPHLTMEPDVALPISMNRDASPFTPRASASSSTTP